MNQPTRRICVAAFCLGVFVLGGCAHFRELKREIVGPSRARLAAHAFLSPDADVRRASILVLLAYPWGLEEPTLRGYALIAGSNDEEPTVRGIALRALGRAGTDAAGYVPQVLDCLKDRSPDVRWDAAVALDTIVDDRAMQPLRDHALEDRSVDVRNASARALRNYRKTAAVETLAACLEDRDYSVGYEARRALVEIAGRDYGPLREDWQPLTKRIPPRPRATPWWDLFGVTVAANDKPSN